jgi:hypothetical protein
MLVADDASPTTEQTLILGSGMTALGQKRTYDSQIVLLFSSTRVK